MNHFLFKFLLQKAKIFASLRFIGNLCERKRVWDIHNTNTITYAVGDLNLNLLDHSTNARKSSLFSSPISELLNISHYKASKSNQKSTAFIGHILTNISSAKSSAGVVKSHLLDHSPIFLSANEQKFDSSKNNIPTTKREINETLKLNLKTKLI